MKTLLLPYNGPLTPKVFTEMYGSEYSVHPVDASILLKGEVNDAVYWETWESVITYANNGKMGICYDGNVYAVQIERGENYGHCGI